MEVINTYLTTVPALKDGDIKAAHLGEFTVLTQDDQGLRACYRAIVDPAKFLAADDTSEARDQADGYRRRIAIVVASGGEKLGYARALASFPNLKRDEYRR